MDVRRGCACPRGARDGQESGAGLAFRSFVIDGKEKPMRRRLPVILALACLASYVLDARNASAGGSHGGGSAPAPAPSGGSAHGGGSHGGGSASGGGSSRGGSSRGGGSSN